MLISTYNINSVNARLPNLLSWLDKAKPDVVLLQEIKTEFNSFPFFEINSAGYEAKVFGQKSYNGVAVLSRYKTEIGYIEDYWYIFNLPYTKGKLNRWRIDRNITAFDLGTVGIDQSVG